MCPCLQIFGNVSYSLYKNNNNNNNTNSTNSPEMEEYPQHARIQSGKKGGKRIEEILAPVITLEMPD